MLNDDLPQFTRDIEVGEYYSFTVRPGPGSVRLGVDITFVAYPHRSLYLSSPDAASLARRPVTELRALFSTQEDKPAIQICRFMHTELFDQVTTLHVLLREHPEEEPTLFSRVVDMVEFRRLKPQSGISNLERLFFDTVMPSKLSGQDGIPRLLRLEQSGLFLLGRVVDQVWHSIYINGHWSLGNFERKIRRGIAIGYINRK